MSTAKHAQEPRLPSLSAVRRHIGAALKPIREALHKTEAGTHRAVTVLGYRFTGARHCKAPGQHGFAWHSYYTGTPLDGTPTQEGWGAVGGNLDEVAEQLHNRMRMVWPESAAIAKATGGAA